MRSIAAVILALAAPALGAQDVREFRIDAGHSDVAFSIGFLGRPVRGRFDDIRGTIVYAAGNPSASAVSVVIGTKSIATGSAHRDDHLRSSDFFDAARYPAIVFRSNRITSGGKGGFVAAGTLAMHGVTRQVSIRFRETPPPVADPHGSRLIFFSGGLRIARKDFGIMGGSTFNDWFDDLRSATMADSVDITLDVSGWDTDYDRIHTYDKPIAQVEKEGITPMLDRFRAMYKLKPDTLRNSEWDLDQFARALFAKGKTAEAIELFEANTEFFARSPGAHASLARAYERTGNRTLARESVARALALDSLDTRSLEINRRIGSPSK